MIIYNVTMKVDWTICEEWLQWMQNKYIPKMIDTGCFEKHQFVQLLQIDDTEGPTFAAQYYATTFSNYDHYLKTYAPSFNDILREKWGDKCLAFSTLMKVI